MQVVSCLGGRRREQMIDGPASVDDGDSEGYGEAWREEDGLTDDEGREEKDVDCDGG